ncbi:MAG TPA: hypothetical protein V6C58_00950 [Allocoleopsis sp.]
MSKRSITIDLPVSILREIAEIAKLQNKSVSILETRFLCKFLVFVLISREKPGLFV